MKYLYSLTILLNVILENQTTKYFPLKLAHKNGENTIHLISFYITYFIA